MYKSIGFMGIGIMPEKLKYELIDYSKLWWVTVLAAFVATCINVIVFLVAQRLGIFDEVSIVVKGGIRPFDITLVIMSSFISVTVSGFGMWVINLFTNKPILVWRNVVIVALLLSLLMPALSGSLMNATNFLIGTLSLMHILGGTVAFYVIPNLVRESI